MVGLIRGVVSLNPTERLHSSDSLDALNRNIEIGVQQNRALTATPKQLLLEIFSQSRYSLHSVLHKHLDNKGINTLTKLKSVLGIQKRYLTKQEEKLYFDITSKNELEKNPFVQFVFDRAENIARELGHSEVSVDEVFVALVEIVNASVDVDNQKAEQEGAHISDSLKRSCNLINLELNALKPLIGDLSSEYLKDWLRDASRAEDNLILEKYPARKHNSNNAKVDLHNLFLDAVVDGKEVTKMVLERLEELDPLCSDNTKALGLALLAFVTEDQFVSTVNNFIPGPDVVLNLQNLRESMHSASFNKIDLEKQIQDLQQLTQQFAYNTNNRRMLIKHIKKYTKYAIHDKLLGPLIGALVNYQDGEMLQFELTNEPSHELGSGDA